MSMTVNMGGASDRLRRFSRNIETGSWHKAVEQVVIEHERRVFETEGAAGGKPWKTLSSPYSLHKVGPALVRTGGLRDSLTGGRGWTAVSVSPNLLKVGSTHPLARLHQSGTRGHRVPARPVLKVTPALRREIRDSVRKSLLS